MPKHAVAITSTSCTCKHLRTCIPDMYACVVHACKTGNVCYRTCVYAQKYKLHSVIRHWGPTKERGHYTACVQNQDGTWLHANDEDMIPCTSDEVLQDDPVWAGTAYILMYVLDTA